MNTDSHTTGPEDDLDVDFLTRCFRKRLACDDVTVVESVKFPRGVSRETWFVTCDVSSAGRTAREQFVLRRDLAGGSICLGDLRSEYEVYKRLNDTDIPVAETLWYEDDPAVLDGRREFFVRRHVEGDWNVPHLLDPAPDYNELRVAIGREHVRKLALVHTCDWRALGFGTILEEPASPDDSAAARVRAVTREIERLRVQPLPLVTEAAEWFIDNPPVSSGRVCLVKGTNGLGEEVFRGREIVAMSDWELACLGDPAMDFALAQTFFDEVREGDQVLWGPEAALDYYRELTGISIEPATIDYYKKLYGLYRIQYSQAAANQLEHADPLCRLAWIGVEVLHLGQTALANAIGCTDTAMPAMGQPG